MLEEVDVDMDGRESMNIRRDSPFAQTPVLKDSEGRYFFDIWKPPFEYIPGIGDVIHTVTAADETRPDLIAWRYYRNPRLWWIIAHANKLLHPWNEIVAGTKLVIPPKELVQKYLGSL